VAVRHVLIDLAPLRSAPSFRRLWVGQSLSGLGSQMTLVAVMFQVWQTTGTIWSGAVGVAQATPVILCGLFAGSVIDRSDRRTFYLTASTGQAVCSGLLAVQGFFGHLPVVGVLVLVAVQSCFVAGSGPASRAFIPQLLPGTQLAAGLALNRITFQAAMLFGPAMGGLVLGWLGVGGCYLIDAITFALAFYGAFRVAADAARRGDVPSGRAAGARRSALRYPEPGRPQRAAD
jgi:hypothetical protein